MAEHAVFTGDMANIADHCGEDAAHALCEVYGGLNLYVRRALDSDGEEPLDKLEPDVARAIRRAFGGSRIYVSYPQAPALTLSHIAELRAKGLNTQQIATRLGVSERQVMRKVKVVKDKAEARRRTARIAPGSRGYPFLKGFSSDGMDRRGRRKLMKKTCPCKIAWALDHGIPVRLVAAFLRTEPAEVERVKSVLATEVAGFSCPDLRGRDLCAVLCRPTPMRAIATRTDTPAALPDLRNGADQ